MNKVAKYRFYVYEILDRNLNVIYVGKGKNNRMLTSLAKRGGTSCREVVRFQVEQDAYNYEIDRIASYPIGQLMNATKGGEGGRENQNLPVISFEESKQAIINAYSCVRLYEKGISLTLANVKLNEMAVEFIEKCKELFGASKVNQLIGVN